MAAKRQNPANKPDKTKKKKKLNKGGNLRGQEHQKRLGLLYKKKRGSKTQEGGLLKAKKKRKRKTGNRKRLAAQPRARRKDKAEPQKKQSGNKGLKIFQSGIGPNPAVCQNRGRGEREEKANFKKP